MRTAESREEVIESDLVRQVINGDRSRDARPALTMDQVVRPNPQIEHVPRLHAVDVMVVVLLSDLR